MVGDFDCQTMVATQRASTVLSNLAGIQSVLRICQKAS
jgi:hypothetical protein